MGLLMLRRTVHLETVLFWASVPLLGMVLVLPWLRIDRLQDALAVPVGASAAVLLALTYSPGYVSLLRCRWASRGSSTSLPCSSRWVRSCASAGPGLIVFLHMHPAPQHAVPESLGYYSLGAGACVCEGCESART
jgi:hypothetical protein